MYFAHRFDGAKPQDSASDSVIFTNLNRPRLFYGKTVHQPGKLLPGERFHLTGITGPLETAGIPVQAFVQQTKSVSFLSAYSDKKAYPKPFVIRTFFE